jgi:hypothetical protein
LADETFFQGIVPQLRLFDPRRHECPNLPAYLIFDAQYLERYSFANRPVGSAVPRTTVHTDVLSELAVVLAPVQGRPPIFQRSQRQSSLDLRGQKRPA